MAQDLHKAFLVEGRYPPKTGVAAAGLKTRSIGGAHESLNGTAKRTEAYISKLSFGTERRQNSLPQSCVPAACEM